MLDLLRIEDDGAAGRRGGQRKGGLGWSIAQLVST